MPNTNYIPFPLTYSIWCSKLIIYPDIFLYILYIWHGVSWCYRYGKLLWSLQPDNLWRQCDIWPSAKVRRSTCERNQWTALCQGTNWKPAWTPGVERCLPYQAVNSQERNEQLKCLRHAGICTIICCVYQNDVERLQKQINIQYSKMTVFDWEVSCLCSCFTILSSQPVLPTATFYQSWSFCRQNCTHLSMATLTMHIQEPDQELGTLS